MVSCAAPEFRGVSYFRSVDALTSATTVLVVLMVFAVFAAPVRAAEMAPWAGPPPPAFTLPQFGAAPGAAVSLAEQSGDTILVHFFASWCESCRDELPALKRLADRGAPGLRVIAIAVADVDAPLRRLIEATGVTFPVLMDRDRAVARAWSISALPSTVVLNAGHESRLIVESDFAWDTVDPTKLIERLASPRPHISVQQSLITQGEPR